MSNSSGESSPALLLLLWENSFTVSKHKRRKDSNDWKKSARLLWKPIWSWSVCEVRVVYSKCVSNVLFGFFFFVVLFKCYSCQACVLLFFKINHFVYSKGRGKKPHILTGKVLLPVSSDVCSCNRLEMCVKVCNVFNHSKNLKHQSTVFNCLKKKKKGLHFALK